MENRLKSGSSGTRGTANSERYNNLAKWSIPSSAKSRRTQTGKTHYRNVLAEASFHGLLVFVFSHLQAIAATSSMRPLNATIDVSIYFQMVLVMTGLKLLMQIPSLNRTALMAM